MKFDVRFLQMWPNTLISRHMTGLGLVLVILLTVGLVTAWGDNLPFPKVLAKEIPTRLVTVGAGSRENLEQGVIPADLRRAFIDKGAGLSDRATVSIVEEGSEWIIVDPLKAFLAVREGSKLNIGDGLLNVDYLQYHEDLGKGILSENLREGFKFKEAGISDSAKVSTVEEGNIWEIIDERRVYLIARQNHLIIEGVAVNVSPGTDKALDGGVIPEGLKVELRREEIVLADSATVEMVAAGASWQINDPAKTYTVTKGEDQLIVDRLEQREVFLNKDIADGVDTATDYVTREGDLVFEFIGNVIKTVLTWIEDALLWLPWPVLITCIALVAWRMAGFYVALFSGVSLLLVGFVGLWPSAMETLSLMLTAVAISTLLAIPIGITAARSNAVDAMLRPILDGMQTMPSFVYLVPAIFFFGLGNVPAVVATIIYAVPPAIRLTNLGIRQVSPETVEAARAFGGTPTQILVKVQMPLALPTIMAGINQTTMMALAMVVVASLVGAGGLGKDVLTSISRLEIGNSLLAGMSIVFLAIIIDRITQGFASSRA